MDPFNEKQAKCPSTLIVLTILTFVNSGFSFLSHLLLSFSPDLIPKIIDVLQMMGYPQAIIDIYSEMIGIASWKFLLAALCYALAIIGAVLMLKLNKLGFHLYVISQILLFAVSNFVLLGAFKMSFMGAFWSLLFIGCYALQIKYMNKPNSTETIEGEESQQNTNEPNNQE
ncbi:MAG: hypothetical protein RR356_06965 [Bacteroidales bacterium]